MNENCIVHNGFGVKKSISLIFTPSDNFLTDSRMKIDAELIYNILRTYLPASTYFELIKLMRGDLPINETKK